MGAFPEGIAAPDAEEMMMGVHSATHFDPALLIPALILLAIDLAIVVYCLEDLLKPERRVSGDNKAVWALIIIFSGIGWIFYLAFGRQDR